MSEEVTKQEIGQQQKQTLVKGLIPVILFLIAQTGYWISTVARIETTQLFMLDALKELKAEVKSASGDRYTKTQAKEDASKTLSYIVDIKSFYAELEKRVRRLEQRRS